jgi:predicted dehydrogenase
MQVGMVGLGKMGLLHSAVLNTLDDVQIVSIAEKDSLVTKHLKSVLPKINVYKDLDEMLASENLDLVHITTPVASHLPLTLTSIKKKINFFVEKPLTRNLDEAKQICSELKNSNLIHSVGYNVRFLETFSNVKSLLEENVLGDIINVNSTMYVSNIFSKPSGWRFKKKISGGGVLLELGCHLVDLLLWYFGPITNVIGKIKTVYSEVEDFAHAEFEFEKGIKGELDTSWSKEGYTIPEINLEIKGTNGSLRVNQDFIEMKLKNPVQKFKQSDVKIYKQELEKGLSFDVAGTDYTKEDMHIVDCVKNKKQTLVNVFEASKTQSVIQAIYDSDSEKRSISVDYID